MLSIAKLLPILRHGMTTISEDSTRQQQQQQHDQKKLLTVRSESDNNILNI